MVATRLTEITTKGLDWYNGESSPSRKPRMDTASEDRGKGTPSNYNNVTWDYASHSISYAAEQTYSVFAGAASYFYTDSTGPAPHTPMDANGNRSTREITQAQPRTTLPMSKKSEFMSWMRQNPYSSVRGRHHQPSSMSAVRSLLTLVPLDNTQQQEIYRHQRLNAEDRVFPTILTDQVQPEPFILDDSEVTERHGVTSIIDVSSIANDEYNDAEDTLIAVPSKLVSSAETASQLAEGTVRALRDIALEEARELHFALRYWTERWENPFWSWLEAGPWAWFSNGGYQHQEVGRKVSQIQAVLARRCSAIGELQQHILRAGWQRGVAQWGVLGEGGQWAPVAGCDGAMERDLSQLPNETPTGREAMRRGLLSAGLDQSAHALVDTSHCETFHSRTMQSTISNLGEHITGQLEKKEAYYGHGNVFVSNTSDGTIFADDSALAEWSIDAILLVRSQLYRAGNGEVEIPYAENWSGYDKKPGDRDETTPNTESKDNENGRLLPRWADLRVRSMSDGGDQDIGGPRMKVVISNLPLLASEVNELLNSVEEIMEVQRERRLNKLVPPHWIRRNWYITTVTTPTVGYFLIKMFHDGYGRMLANFFVEKVGTFVKEHVTDPLAAIYVELFKGREGISDREARTVAIFTLKKMIRSWLDETYPNMPVEERTRRAEIMDISLLEETKEQNMKSLYEINSVIRMSFIEMQFIKKELLNALVAMDDMMQSNEINMNLAAVTPAVLLIYLAQRGAKFFLYALLKIGKSRGETYSSFRQIVLDIERLLVMRHNPPSAPSPLSWGSKPAPSQDALNLKQAGTDRLSADDTGMLMLHIHECRTILWQDRARFSAATIRNVAEDLAELAGERGAVSVQQQIMIVARMGRTYPFLKVLSTGTPFTLSRVHSRMV